MDANARMTNARKLLATTIALCTLNLAPAYPEIPLPAFTLPTCSQVRERVNDLANRRVTLETGGDEFSPEIKWSRTGLPKIRHLAAKQAWFSDLPKSTLEVTCGDNDQVIDLAIFFDSDATADIEALYLSVAVHAYTGYEPHSEILKTVTAEILKRSFTGAYILADGARAEFHPRLGIDIWHEP